MASLGGLARTAEIFQASKLVLGSTKVRGATATLCPQPSFSNHTLQIPLCKSHFEERKVAPAILVGSLKSWPQCVLWFFECAFDCPGLPQVAEDPAFVSVSVTASSWLPMEVVEPGPSLLESLLQCQRRGYGVVAAADAGLFLHPEVVPLGNFSFPTKTILLLGGERTGLPADLLPVIAASAECVISCIRRLPLTFSRTESTMLIARQSYHGD